MNDSMKVSLVISTYNSTDALRLVLASVARQTLLPHEVLIADDGSTDETRRVVDRFRPQLNIKHVWQEDKGFRRARVINKAFAASTGDYIVQIDGDIILDRHFVADHVSEARPGYYMNGSRAKLTEALTREIKQLDSYTPHIYGRGVTRRFNALRCPLLTPFFYEYRKHKMVRGCNMAFWRSDLLRVNGYDNRMVGYGGEDVDLSIRLEMAGVRRRFIKFKAIEYHIYHPDHSTKGTCPNTHIWQEHQAGGIVHTKLGMAEFLPQL